MSDGSAGPVTFASAEAEGDAVRYPCLSCGGSQSMFVWNATTTAASFADHDAVFETDARTFLGVNEYDGNEPVRFFECEECGQAIAHFPESGIQYVA